MTRKNPNLTEKLASALLELQRLRGDPIDREHAKLMTADQIVSLFQFDHAAGFACHGKDNHPTGLTPLLTPAHRAKTAKKDMPAIARCNRLSEAQEAFRAKMLEKVRGDVDAVMARPKLRAKMGNRGFDKTRRRKMNGTVLRRED